MHPQVNCLEVAGLPHLFAQAAATAAGEAAVSAKATPAQAADAAAKWASYSESDAIDLPTGCVPKYGIPRTWLWTYGIGHVTCNSSPIGLGVPFFQTNRSK